MNEKHLSAQRYVTLTAIILLLLGMLFFMLNLEGFIRAKEPDSVQEEQIHSEQANGPGFLNQESLPKETVMIEGKELVSATDLTPLNDALKEKKPVVFLSLPTQEFIEEFELTEILGIEKISGEHTQKELNLVAGFLLGGFYQFEDLAYEALDIELSFSTKMYGFGKKTQRKESPVIWRNTYEKTEIYVVNGPFMSTKAAYGILAAILSEIQEEYMYPILNTRLMIYENFPYISDKNKSQLIKNYNRDAMKLQQDILFPDLLSVNKLRGFVPNGFFRLGFDEAKIGSLKPYTKRELATYQEQIFNDGGEVGLSYSGNIEQDLKDYARLFPNVLIKSVFINDETTDTEIGEILRATDTIETIVGPSDPERNYQYLNEQVVYIPYSKEGFIQDGQEELDFIALVTAFGAIVDTLNVEEVIDPADGQEVWTGGYKDYVQFLDQYRERFSFLNNRNITETGTALKTILNNEPSIQTYENSIELNDPNWSKESHYILRTKKKVNRVENGIFKKIEEDAYLITAKGKKVTVEVD